MDENGKSKPSRPKQVVSLVKLEPYAIQFRDSEQHLRSYYAFRNPGGRFFLLDVTPDDLLMPAPINVPAFESVEKIEHTKLGLPKIMATPDWLEKALNDKIDGKVPDDAEAPAEDEDKSDAMKAAALGEEG